MAVLEIRAWVSTCVSLFFSRKKKSQQVSLRNPFLEPAASSTARSPSFKPDSSSLLMILGIIAAHFRQDAAHMHQARNVILVNVGQLYLRMSTLRLLVHLCFQWVRPSMQWHLPGFIFYRSTICVHCSQIFPAPNEPVKPNRDPLGIT